MKTIIFFLFVVSQGVLSAQTSQAKDSLYREAYAHAMESIAEGNVPSAIFYLKECAAARPQEAVVYYELSRMYDRLSEGNQMLYYARKAYSLSPSNVWWEEYLLSSAIKYKKYDVAVTVLENRYARDDQFLSDLLNLYMVTSSWDKIISVLDERETHTPLTLTQQQYRMQALMEKKDYKRTLKTAETVLKKYPDDTETARQKLLSLHGMGKTEKAWKYFSEYYAQHPADGKAAYTMMPRYNEMRDYTSLMRALNVVAGDTTMTTASRIKVMEAVLPVMIKDTAYIDDYEKALHTLTLNATDDYPSTYAYAGEYYFAKKDMQQALGYYRKALHSGYTDRNMIQKLLYIEVQNEDVENIYTDAALMLASGVEDADILTQYGLAAYRKGHVDEAINAIERALNLSGDISMNVYGQLCSFLGTLYHDAGKDEKSDACFEKALSILPDDPSTLNNYAYFLSLRGMDLDRAMNMSRKALAQEPENDSYMDTYAYLLYLHGEYAEALKVMEKVMKMSENPSAEVLEHYRDILSATGDKEKSREVDEMMKKKIREASQK